MRLGLVLLLITGASCGPGGDDDDMKEMPPFPDDYRTSYTEVRDCRKSGDHNLNNIRVLAGPTALDAYQNRTVSFPVDSVVIKEEFDFSDLDCTGEVILWTVMQRLPEGSSASTLDWTWYQVDRDRNITSKNFSACIGCHTGCGNPPDGYQGTCAVP